MNDHSLSAPNCAACAISSTINRICAFPGELSRWFDSNAQGWAPLFLRLLLAYEFGEAGLEKLNGDNWFADLTFPFPVNLLPADVSWTLATGLEMIAPVVLILGLATRFFSCGVNTVDGRGDCRCTLACRMARSCRAVERLRHYRSGLRQLQTAADLCADVGFAGVER